MGISENLKKLKERIEAVCSKIKKDPDEVKIVAVSKGVEVPKIKEALTLGLKMVAENRIQEAIRKIPLINEEVEWHFVGHLQTNKAKKALEYFSVIQSLDSLHLAEALEKEALKQNKIVRVFIQVNTSFEETKYGINPDEVERLVSKVLDSSHLKLDGLMTLGPISALSDPENSRKSFRLLYELKEKIEKIFLIKLPYLSMGMSSDFEVAIEEGSNMIRIGTLIFSA